MVDAEKNRARAVRSILSVKYNSSRGNSRDLSLPSLHAKRSSMGHIQIDSP